MRHYRSDVTAVMASSPSFWKATQYLIGNHTIAERMFRHETAMTKLRRPRVPTSDRD
jgi:hypothetical protein